MSIINYKTSRFKIYLTGKTAGGAEEELSPCRSDGYRFSSSTFTVGVRQQDTHGTGDGNPQSVSSRRFPSEEVDMDDIFTIVISSQKRH